jgi:hypothetical protein
MAIFASLITHVNKAPAMTMNMGKCYRCQNPDCRCEIEVIQASMEAVLNQRCCCGREMKKPFTEPMLKILGYKPAAFSDLERTLN